MTPSNIFLTLFTVLLIIWLKLYNIVATNDDLLFLLIPTKFLVEIFTSATALYTDNGYFFELLNITIDKSCAGVNFFILSFSLFAFVGFTYLDRVWKKIIAIFVAILLGYFLTIFATFSRIIITLYIEPLKFYFDFIDSAFFHELLGGFVYLFLLVLSYLFLDKIFNNKRITNE
ncbi:MAG: exosortase K [Sulfurovum sp.]